MRFLQNAVFSALLRVQRFFGEYAAALTGDVDFTAARKRLDDVIASFTTHAVEQNATDRDTKGESAKQQQLRVQLSTDVMRPIAEIARRNLRTTPEFKALQMPKRRIGGPAFVASANGMAEAATIHKDTLIERGLPADFLDQFKNGVAQLEASASDRETSRTRRMGATQGLVFQQQEGRSVLKVLDALVRRALRGNAALLATWQGARAIHRRPGGGSTSTTPSTSPATPTTTPANTPAPHVAADA
ncbi:MAG TPA: hypothetical protein VGJ18_04065 [Gemmatimonadaceae bacterium]